MLLLHFLLVESDSSETFLAVLTSKSALMWPVNQLALLNTEEEAGREF